MYNKFTEMTYEEVLQQITGKVYISNGKIDKYNNEQVILHHIYNHLTPICFTGISNINTIILNTQYEQEIYDFSYYENCKTIILSLEVNKLDNQLNNIYLENKIQLSKDSGGHWKKDYDTLDYDYLESKNNLATTTNPIDISLHKNAILISRLEQYFVFQLCDIGYRIYSPEIKIILKVHRLPINIILLNKSDYTYLLLNI